jgi:hypothetical protein
VQALQEQLSVATAKSDSLLNENKLVQALAQKYREEHELNSTQLVYEMASILNRIVDSKDFEVPAFSSQKQEYLDLGSALLRVKQKIDKARGDIQVP